jgi:hypothetical protein
MNEDHRQQARRRYRSRNLITAAEPELVPMTDEQQQDAITVLSRLFAELLVNEEFMAVRSVTQGR